MFSIAAEYSVSSRLGEDISRGHLLNYHHVEEAVFYVSLPTTVDESPDVADKRA